MCERDQCIIEPEITNSINFQTSRYGWLASNYSEFWGHKLEEGVKLRLGTILPHKIVMHMNTMRLIYDPSGLPRQFDSEDKWPRWITPVQDQGWCGSSWAISTAAVASDRYVFGIFEKFGPIPTFKKKKNRSVLALFEKNLLNQMNNFKALKYSFYAS